MKSYKRHNSLFSACGLNCGLCPRYHTDGTSKCPGCGGEGFLEKHPSCGALSCCQRHGIEYCFLCDEYPCKKYDGADAFDSFITHRNQFKDMQRIKSIGLEAYQSELDAKMEILQKLLQNYNDGRRKNFYCIAVNLLELQDVQHTMEQIALRTQTDNLTIKEKSTIAAECFQVIAEKRDIVLKLREKNG